jgi:hypothetical protein
MFFQFMFQRWTSILYVGRYWWNWLWSSFHTKYLIFVITAPCGGGGADVAVMWTCALENAPALNRLLSWHCNSSRPKFEPGTVPPRMQDVTCISEYSKLTCKYPGCRNRCCRTLVGPLLAINVNCLLTVISGFRHDVDEMCAFLGYYAMSSGTPLPTFRYNVLAF